MAQKIRIKRNVTSAVPPPTLDPGELAYMKSGQKLYVGDDTNTVVNLVSTDRQLEIHAGSPVQTVDALAGAKTFPIAKIKVPGGNVGEFLSMSAVDGTLSYAPMVSASQQFVGSFDAAAGVVTYTTTSTGTGPGLPVAAPANNGWYVICDTAGAVVPANVPPGTYNIGDWIISNGGLWTHLSFGGIETDMASEIGVAPAVLTEVTVQAALEALAAADAAFVVGPALSVLDNIATYADATGHLIKDSATKLTDLATKTYVDNANTAQDATQDTRDDAQDVLIADNATAIAGLVTNDAAQDAALLNKITKPASVAAIGNIATYADLTGGVALDGGESLADINAKIALKADTATTGDVKGQTAAIAAADNIAVYNAIDPKAIKDGGMTLASITASIALKQDAATAGDVKGPASVLADGNLAVYNLLTGKLIKDGGISVAGLKTYVDTAIAAIPGATPPAVTAPELTGDGAAGTPITFTGITTGAATGAAPDASGCFRGTGLSTDPLILELVDRGDVDIDPSAALTTIVSPLNR